MRATEAKQEGWTTSQIAKRVELERNGYLSQYSSKGANIEFYLFLEPSMLHRECSLCGGVLPRVGGVALLFVYQGRNLSNDTFPLRLDGRPSVGYGKIVIGGGQKTVSNRVLEGAPSGSFAIILPRIEHRSGFHEPSRCGDNFRRHVEVVVSYPQAPSLEDWVI